MRMTARPRRLAIAAAALLAVSTLTIAVWQACLPQASGAPGVPPGPSPVIYSRVICSFSNDDATSANVQGADGGMSVVLGDRIYWLFGDTLYLSAAGKQIAQNSIAWSDAATATGDDCPTLTYYTRSGTAAPILGKDGSLTVWPAAAWPVDDHTLGLYTVYVYGSGPYDYWFGEMGVARLDTRTMEATVTARSLWDADSGFGDQVIGAQPVEVADDGLLRLVLQTEHSTKYLARVAPDALADASAYEYWDGEAWSRAPSDAGPLWKLRKTDDPVERLGQFENGGSIAWNEALGKYVAIVNTGYDRIGARFADRLEGPWSEPQPWLDCLAFAESRVPACYSPFQHPHLARDAGRLLFVTLTRMATYDVVAMELRIGVPVHARVDANGARGYGVTVPEGATDEGVAFYASDTKLRGFRPVYEWRRGAEVTYAAGSPGTGFRRGAVAFYAPLAETVDASATRYRPVYDWSDRTMHMLSLQESGLEDGGYERGGVAFYAP